MRKVQFAWFVMVVAAVALTGCGGDDDDAGGDGNGGDAAATTTTASDGGGGSDGVKVTIVDFAFQPASVTVKVGGEFPVTNAGSTAHTYTSTGAGIDVKLDQGASGVAKVTTTTTGTYDVVCTLHSTMQGKVTVEAA